MTKRHVIYYLLIIFFIVAVNSGFVEICLDLVTGAAWSHGLVEFLKASTQHLIVILLLAIYLDFLRPAPKIFDDTALAIAGLKEDVSALRRLVEKSSNLDTKVMIEEALRHRYGVATNIENLISTVLSPKPSYTGYRSSYILKNIPSIPGHYQLTWEQSFISPISEYIVALVNNAALQDVISAAAPPVNDVFVFSDSLTAPVNEAQFETGGVKLKYFTPNDKGSMDCTVLSFRAISRDSYPIYLGSVAHNEYDNIKLWACAIPSSLINGRCSVTYNFQMRKDDHYLFWVADRPIFIETLSIDASRFSGKAATHFICQPFIVANSTREPLTETNYIYTIEVHNWIVKGQGVIFSWR